MSAPQGNAPTCLTPREQVVLAHIANGLTGVQIAAQMQISAKTVSSHREHLFAKFNVHRSTHLIRQAAAQGFLIL